MSEDTFFIVPVIRSTLLEVTVAADLARRFIPDCHIVGLVGTDFELDSSVFDRTLDAGALVKPYEPRAMTPDDLMSLAAPTALQELLSEYAHGIWCGAGIVPRSGDIFFDKAPVTVAAPVAIPQRGSLTPALPPPLGQRPALPDARLILVSSGAEGFLQAWHSVGHDAVVDLNQAPIREHMNNFIARVPGRSDVALDNSNLLMSWVDYSAIASGEGGPSGSPSFLDATSLFVDAVTQFDEPDTEGPTAVEWEMVFNRVRNTEPVRFVRDLISERVSEVVSTPETRSMDFARSVRRSVDPFGHRWCGPGSSKEFLDWLGEENQFGFSRSSDLTIRSTGIGLEFPDARYAPTNFYRYLDRGGIFEIGFDPRTMVEAPKQVTTDLVSKKFEPFRWRWNIVKQLAPGFLRRESSDREARTAVEPKRKNVEREPSLWGDPPRSLSLIGGLRSESGLGQAARASSQALNLLGRSYTYIDTSAVFPSRNSADPGLDWDQYGNYGDVNLIHSNADEMIAWADGPYRHRFGGRFNAAMWFWETTQLPLHSQEAFDVVDELWVASEYLVDVFGQYGRVPVHNVGIATKLPADRTVDRSRFSLHDDEFVFLFVYDAFSSYGRKNPEKALQAFVNAFAPHFRGVKFVLKVANLGKFPASQARLLEMQARYPAIVIIDEYLAYDDVLDLMAAADVYVSLHSAEGYGLTLLEAMALGTPTICTGYSGNMDFTTEANSWLVDYNMARIEEPTGPYPAGSVWASPNVDSATELMQLAEGNRDEVARKGALAQADAVEAASLEKYAYRLDAELRRVGA